MKNKISVILPTYNEVDTIIPLIEQIAHQLSNENYEIIVVDDNSPDGTSDTVKEAMKRFTNLRLLTRTSAKGLVPSIRDGIKISTGNICIWMDADLSMPPSLIKQFVKEINLGAELVVGSRYIPGGGLKGAELNGKKTSLYRIWKNLSTSEDSFVTAMISKLGNKMLRIILDSSLHDYSSGFFGAKKETLKKIELEGNIVDYCISLSYRAIRKGLKVVEVPMIIATRKYGKSKTSNTLPSILIIAYQCLKKAFLLRFTLKNQFHE